MQSSLTLYRPVGLIELRLIAQLGFRAFPPRLPEQPIFYPVLSHDYAIQIARDWNPTDKASGFAGFVTRFDVDQSYADRFEVQTVGATEHRELWVPSEELDEFNRHIVGTITVLESYYGDDCDVDIEPTSGLPRDVAEALTR